MASPGSPPRSPFKWYSSVPTVDFNDDDDEDGGGRAAAEEQPSSSGSGGSSGGGGGGGYDDRQRQQQQARELSSGMGSSSGGSGGSGSSFASPPVSPTRAPGSSTLRHASSLSSSAAGRAAAAAALGEADSPYFRERVRASIAETKACSSGMKDLVKGAKELGKATAALASGSRAMARASGKAAARLPAEEGGVQPLLQRFGATLHEMAVAQETLAHALGESFVAPLEAFCAEEGDRLAELEKAYEREKGEFTEALGKLLRTHMKPTTITGAGMGGGAGGVVGGGGPSLSSLSSGASLTAASAGAPKGIGGGGPGAGGVLVQRARELGRSRREFEQARLRLAARVEEVETRRTLEVTEGVGAVLLHLESHHRLCLDVLAGLGPSIERLREAQAAARERLEAGKGQWERKEEMLEMLLPADLAGKMDHVITCTVKQSPSFLPSIDSFNSTAHTFPFPPQTPHDRAAARAPGGSAPRPHPRRRRPGPRRDAHGGVRPLGQEAGRVGRRAGLPSRALPPAGPPRRALRVLPLAARPDQGPGRRRRVAPALVRPGGLAPPLCPRVERRPRRARGGGGGGPAADAHLRRPALQRAGGDDGRGRGRRRQQQQRRQQC